MIEKKIVREKFLEYKIKDFIINKFSDVPIDKVILEKTPLGERITINTATPGLIIGSRGANIANLVNTIKKHFNLENPQIKINDLKNPLLSASAVASKIANNLAKFGSTRFKLTGYKMVESVMRAGAQGVEIKLSGKLPSARAKSWRFVKGFVKKTGYASDFYVDKAIKSVCLKTGVIGIQVEIMKKDIVLPQKIEILEKSSAENSAQEISKEKSELNK